MIIDKRLLHILLNIGIHKAFYIVKGALLLQFNIQTIYNLVFIIDSLIDIYFY